MNRRYEIFKTSSSPPTGKALLSHTIFCPSQTGETVPLNLYHSSWKRIWRGRGTILDIGLLFFYSLVNHCFNLQPVVFAMSSLPHIQTLGIFCRYLSIYIVTITIKNRIQNLWKYGLYSCSYVSSCIGIRIVIIISDNQSIESATVISLIIILNFMSN